MLDFSVSKTESTVKKENLFIPSNPFIHFEYKKRTASISWYGRPQSSRDSAQLFQKISGFLKWIFYILVFFSGSGSLKHCTCLLSPVQTWRAGSLWWRAGSTSGPAWRGSPSGTLSSSSASRPDSGNNSELPRSIPFHHSIKYWGCSHL